MLAQNESALMVFVPMAFVPTVLAQAVFAYYEGASEEEYPG